MSASQDVDPEAAKRADPASLRETWVCLAGGNALGAFHLGAVEALCEAQVQVDRVAGASIGAITAALWLGGPLEEAPARLRRFWSQATDKAAFGFLRSWRQMSLLRALAYGRPGLFHPSLPGGLSAFPMTIDDDHLFDTHPLRRLLLELVDFDALNASPTRVIVTAVDQRTAEDVIFDSAETTLTVDHLMGSSALPLLFPPVELDGKVLVDAAMSANLPLVALFRDPPERDTLCLVSDLWPAADERARSPDDVARRLQDLLFTAQRRNAIAIIGERLRAPLAEASRGVLLRPLIHDGSDWEIAGKAFDFTAVSILRRQQAGAAAMRQALALRDEPIPPGWHVEPQLTGERPRQAGAN